MTTSQGVKIADLGHVQPERNSEASRQALWSTDWTKTGCAVRPAAWKAGAEIVLVAAHTGTEFATRENDQQRRLARTLTASGDVDLVYMHHTHVAQPWAKVNGRRVVYGLGNAVGQQSPNRTPDVRRCHGALHVHPEWKRTVRRQQGGVHPDPGDPLRPGRPARVHVVSASLPKARGTFRRRLLVARARSTAVVTRHDLPGLHRREVLR